MAKKQIGFKTKGMNQDLSVSAFNPEFSFENMNLRLSTNEHNTLLSWVNERGTKEITDITIDMYPWMTDEEWEEYQEEHPEAERTTDTISGTPIGTTVINNQLVIFTNDVRGSNHVDRIYALTHEKETDNNSDSISGSCLFTGNLNFDYEHPIECLVSYETEDIQKVYWVDGLNQPRLINIKASKEKIKEWHDRDEEVCSAFDFVVSMSADGCISVTKRDGSGTFAAGVIQYAFCYINKYGQQSNIVDISPLYYASHADRGGAPDGDDPVGCSFKINLDRLDGNYSTVRLYSIQRTSLNGTPVIKYLDDIDIVKGEDENTAEYIDSGVNGSTVDATSLLYVGGKAIVAETIAEKDNTMFLGNITESTYNVESIQEYFDDIRGTSAADVTFANGGNKVINYNDPTGTVYSNTNTLSESQWKISTFKGGEHYRFGFQLRDSKGIWTNPIFIDDFTNDKYPVTDFQNNTASLVYAYKKLSIETLEDNYTGDFKVFDTIRPVIVHPSMGDRKVLYQGVLNPTVFNAQEKKEHRLSSQPSWFFRPWYNIPTDPYEGSGAFPTFMHYASLPKDTMYSTTIDDRRKVEVMGAVINYATPYSQTDSEANGDNPITKCNSQFFVDQSIVTLDSPDLQLGKEVASFPTEDAKLRFVGIVPITANCSNYDINVSSTSSTIAQELNKVFSISNKGIYSGNRLISDYLWKDSFMTQHNGVYILGNPKVRWIAGNYNYDGYMCDFTGGDPDGNFDIATNYLLFPWEAKRSITNDWYQSTAMLDTKKMMTQLYSCNSYYFDSTQRIENDNIALKIHYFENSPALQLPAQSLLSDSNMYSGTVDFNISSFSYKPPYDDITYPGLEPSENRNTYPDSRPSDPAYISWEEAYSVARYWLWCLGSDINISTPMRYKSATHAVISFRANSDGEIPILPSLNSEYNDYDTEIGEAENYQTFWESTMKFTQPDITNVDTDILDFPGLFLAEVYRDVTSPFGGKSENALANNVWQIGGEAIPLAGKTEVTLKWENGDTFYQRYDCMKTMPYSNDDVNQNTEILSFLCETRVNLDGRYDANRVTNASILNRVSETNFNLMNPVYNQEDNYFTSRIVKNEDATTFHYPNYVYYSRTKTPGADVDTYTNIVLSSVLDLDGDKGEVRAIRKLNNHLFTFQDSGISRIMFNDNVQIQSTEGVPIEIANSGKVLGKDYISNTVGCSNKWSIVQTPNGIYFMDSNDKSIYLFNGQLENISSKNGFNTWCKQNIPASDVKWDPVAFENFIGHYDRQNQEVLYINNEKALAWNEKLGAFTSFYDYGSSPFFENLKDVGLWIRSDGSIWRHQAGEYCNFFGTEDNPNYKPYGMTLVGNPEPQMDKIFTNLEFRASVEGDGEPNQNADKFTFYLPFDSLETWNEYQHGIAYLQNKNGQDVYRHNVKNQTAALLRKFRIWRCDIPRDNYKYVSNPVIRRKQIEWEHKHGIYRHDPRVNDRMRNPWLYLKLWKEEDTNKRAEIHDIVMSYFD